MLLGATVSCAHTKLQPAREPIRPVSLRDSVLADGALPVRTFTWSSILPFVTLILPRGRARQRRASGSPTCHMKQCTSARQHEFSWAITARARSAMRVPRRGACWMALQPWAASRAVPRPASGLRCAGDCCLGCVPLPQCAATGWNVHPSVARKPKQRCDPQGGVPWRSMQIVVTMCVCSQRCAANDVQLQSVRDSVTLSARAMSPQEAHVPSRQLSFGSTQPPFEAVTPRRASADRLAPRSSIFPAGEPSPPGSPAQATPRRRQFPSALALLGAPSAAAGGCGLQLIVLSSIVRIVRRAQLWACGYGCCTLHASCFRCQAVVR